MVRITIVQTCFLSSSPRKCGRAARPEEHANAHMRQAYWSFVYSVCFVVVPLVRRVAAESLQVIRGYTDCIYAGKLSRALPQQPTRDKAA